MNKSVKSQEKHFSYCLQQGDGDLKMIIFQSVLRTPKLFFYVLICDSCKMSQNVTIFCLHEVNTEFHVNCHYGCKALFFILSDIARCQIDNFVAVTNNFVAVKIKETVRKRIENASKVTKDMWFITNNIDLPYIE